MVAAPNCHARIVAQTPNLVFDFSLASFHKLVVAWIRSGTEHELLEDHDSPFGTFFIELVTFINTASPYLDYINIGFLKVIHHLLKTIRVFVVWKY